MSGAKTCLGMLSAKCPNTLLFSVCLFTHVHDNTPAQNHVLSIYMPFSLQLFLYKVHLQPDVGTHFPSEYYSYCVISYLISCLHPGRILLTTSVWYCIDSPSVAHCFSKTQKQSLYTNIYSKQYYNEAYIDQNPYLHCAS